jgi:exodeoxyribonuclease V beta subunit
LESSESYAASPRAVSLPGGLFPALDDNLGKRRLVVRSFSSLHRASVRLHFGEDTAHADDEEPDLPEDPFRGPVFGEIVHLVLETIDFAAVAAAADPAALVENGSGPRAVLDAAIAKHLPKMRGREPPEQRRHACTVKVAQLVWNGLRSPLPGLGGCLCDIPSGQRIHELEFLFPQSYGEIAPAEVRLEEGFFTGFMDLVFRKGGLYYLLDWKTNDLDAYDQAAIARAMEQSGYHRQYRLYLHALGRWLGRRHGPNFDFLKHCGGVYYLFLRGMTDNSSGVFYHRPTANDLNLDLILGDETHGGASPRRSRGIEPP